MICLTRPQVKYKEKYEKEKGKAMLDFETPTYVTAKEAQHMQSQVKTPLLPLLLIFLFFPFSVFPGICGKPRTVRLLTCTVMRLVASHKLELTVCFRRMCKEKIKVKMKLELNHQIQFLQSSFYVFLPCAIKVTLRNLKVFLKMCCSVINQSIIIIIIIF